VVVFPGTLGVAEAVPEVQDTVTGRPVIPELVEENVQLEEWVTVAETMTMPPVEGTGEGEALRVLMDGAGVAAAAGPVLVRAVPTTMAPPLIKVARISRPLRNTRRSAILPCLTPSRVGLGQSVSRPPMRRSGGEFNQLDTR